jgi:hypothetical protein
VVALKAMAHPIGIPHADEVEPEDLESAMEQTDFRSADGFSLEETK